MIKTKKTIRRDDGKAYVANSEQKHNYLGQMMHMVYPDGEKLEYAYDAGGAGEWHDRVSLW